MSGNEMPRFGGLATMMRLPTQKDAEGLDACFVGILFDIGTSNRSGARYALRQIRAESSLLRPNNMATNAAPFDSMRVADIGDVAINTFNLEKAMSIIEAAYDEILNFDCKPLTLGGEHTVLLPILRAIKKKHGPVALIHVDAHADVNDQIFREEITHGTPVGRVIEESLVDPALSVQIGLRGTGYSPEDFDWARGKGVRVIQAEECWYKSLAPVVDEIRRMLGIHPVYVSYDVDSLDPAFAPGTGTPEIGGLTIIQRLEIVRGYRGLNIVGADLVEVSPPYGTSSNTALVAANLLYEMPCVLPGVL